MKLALLNVDDLALPSTNLGAVLRSIYVRIV
jgi:hypothetical protein